MTYPTTNSGHLPASTTPKEVLRIVAWLNTSTPPEAGDELTALTEHLATLRNSLVERGLRLDLLDQIFRRSVAVFNEIRPSLSDAVLPLPRHARRQVRCLHELLRSLTEDLLATLNTGADDTVGDQRKKQAQALHNAMYSASQHVLVSDLVASPVEPGSWLSIHRTYATARRLGVTSLVPEGRAASVQHLYQSTLLLECAQPASFTSREVAFVADYLDRFADEIEWNIEPPEDPSATFWIDPDSDLGAMACTRKSAPKDRSVGYFSCDRLTALLRSQLVALGAGCSASKLNLPHFAETTAGRGVLRRLVAYWGDPNKRRFPRRRQGNRAVLCAGLENLWRLFQDGRELGIDTSSWMITNESPDGYAVMHVKGTTEHASVGDIVAMRAESATDWKTCIIRWALSENQVHFELGLQILATTAIPAQLVQRRDSASQDQLSVLVLPEVPAIRASEMMVVPSGALSGNDHNHVLVFEKENVAVREVTRTGLNEQNSRIEVFSITGDALSDNELPEQRDNTASRD